MVWIAVAAFLAALDLGIKYWIEKQDQAAFPRDLEVCKGAVILEKYHNPGLPFGFLKENRVLVEKLPLGVLAVAGGWLAWLLTKKGRTWQKLSLTLILGGALSNQYDRIRRSYVVDYFSFRWKPVRWIVFNLGDIYIFIGSILLFLRELLCGKKEK